MAARLIEAVDVLDAYLGLMGAVIAAVHASGTPNRRPGRGRSTGRDAAQAATRQALLEVFEGTDLRLPAQAVTDAFLGMFFGRASGVPRTTPATTEQFVDLFLHGALRHKEPA